MKRNFKSLDAQDVETLFGIEQKAPDLPVLKHWLEAEDAAFVTPEQRQALEALRADLAANVLAWNEEELKIEFIGPLLKLVNYRTKQSRLFYERTMRAAVGGVELAGKVDMVVATGKHKPVRPFFFIHEYKQEGQPDSHPLGQLLAEMVAAQALNQDGLPIYGSYVIGRNWHFVTLDNQAYAVSEALLASQEDIVQIFAILCQAKAYIQRRLELEFHAKPQERAGLAANA